MTRVLGLRRRSAALLATGAVLLAVGATGCITATSVSGNVLSIVGSGGDDTIVLRLKAGDANTLEVDDGNNGTADASFDRTTFTSIVVDGGAGNDQLSVSEANGAFSTTELTTLLGGSGSDQLVGGSGLETLDGGPGNDVLDGNQSNDRLDGGDDIDLFAWAPGEGSDTIDGGLGADALAFTGSNVSEIMDVSNSGGHVRLTRNVAAVAIDLVDVETISLATLGGADSVAVGNLTGTDLTTFAVDAAATGGVDDAAADDVRVPPSTVVGRDGTAATASGSGLGAQVRVVNGFASDRLVVAGTAGADQAQLLGTSSSETVTAVATGTDVVVTGLTPGLPVTFSSVEALGVDLGVGSDQFTPTGNFGATTALDVSGGDGLDTLAGSNGVDTLDGGAGVDVIDGNQGNDTVRGGGDADTVVWDPGDGSDAIDGGTGTDKLVFNGSNVAEIMDVSNNGGVARLTRNISNINMDLAGIETVDINALAGADVVNVGNLTGTGLATVTVDVSASGSGDDGSVDDVRVPPSTAVGSSGSVVTASGVGLGTQVRVANGFATDRLVVVGNGATDQATVTGTSSSETVTAVATGTDVVVTGLTPGVPVVFSSVEALGVALGVGDDQFTPTGSFGGVTALNVSGGDGADTLKGSTSPDTLDGGIGADVIDGNQGVDTVLGGGDADTLVWDPGDGSDVVDGGSGTDQLVLNGSNVGEILDVANNAGHVRLTRNIGAVTLDLVKVETITIGTLGGADTLAVHDLSATAVTTLNANLGSTLGGTTPDGVVDQISVDGTGGDDTVKLTASGGILQVTGLHALVQVTGPDVASDTLAVNGLLGVDTITPTAAASAFMQLVLLP